MVFSSFGGLLGKTKVFSIFESGSWHQLGPFELQVMQELRSQGSATVRELLADGKTIAGSN
jgi:hypothetical protein